MAAPVRRSRTPTGTGAEMLHFKSANGSRASRRWAKSGKAKHISKVSSLKVYRASRWSAIGLVIPAQKQYLTTASFLMEAFTGEGKLVRKATGYEQEKLKPRYPTSGSRATQAEPPAPIGAYG